MYSSMPPTGGTAMPAGASSIPDHARSGNSAGKHPAVVAISLLLAVTSGGKVAKSNSARQV